MCCQLNEIELKKKQTDKQVVNVDLEQLAFYI